MERKILILSDTHGFLHPNIFDIAQYSDEIWHAGDWGTWDILNELQATGKPVRGVFGNIDGWDIRQELPEFDRFQLDGKDILITHIAGTPPSYNHKIMQILKQNPPYMLICGHTHILKVYHDKRYNMWYINPGAAGKYGPQKVSTVLQMFWNSKEGKPTRFRVIELT